MKGPSLSEWRQRKSGWEKSRWEREGDGRRGRRGNWLVCEIKNIFFKKKEVRKISGEVHISQHLHTPDQRTSSSQTRQQIHEHMGLFLQTSMLCNFQYISRKVNTTKCSTVWQKSYRPGFCIQQKDFFFQLKIRQVDIFK